MKQHKDEHMHRGVSVGIHSFKCISVFIKSAWLFYQVACWLPACYNVSPHIGRDVQQKWWWLVEVWNLVACPPLYLERGSKHRHHCYSCGCLYHKTITFNASGVKITQQETMWHHCLCLAPPTHISHSWIKTLQSLVQSNSWLTEEEVDELT